MTADNMTKAELRFMLHKAELERDAALHEAAQLREQLDNVRTIAENLVHVVFGQLEK